MWKRKEGKVDTEIDLGDIWDLIQLEPSVNGIKKEN